MSVSFLDELTGGCIVPWLINELNREGQSVSIKYKMVHGLNQNVFRTSNLEMFPILDLSVFQS